MLVARYILEIKTEGVPWIYDTPSITGIRFILPLYLYHSTLHL